MYKVLVLLKVNRKMVVTFPDSESIDQISNRSHPNLIWKTLRMRQFNNKVIQMYEEKHEMTVLFCH